MTLWIKKDYAHDVKVLRSRFWKQFRQQFFGSFRKPLLVRGLRPKQSLGTCKNSMSMKLAEVYQTEACKKSTIRECGMFRQQVAVQVIDIQALIIGVKRPTEILNMYTAGDCGKAAQTAAGEYPPKAPIAQPHRPKLCSRAGRVGKIRSPFERSPWSPAQGQVKCY